MGNQSCIFVLLWLHHVPNLHCSDVFVEICGKKRQRYRKGDFHQSYTIGEMFLFTRPKQMGIYKPVWIQVRNITQIQCFLICNLFLRLLWELGTRSLVSGPAKLHSLFVFLSYFFYICPIFNQSKFENVLLSATAPSPKFQNVQKVVPITIETIALETYTMLMLWKIYTEYFTN